MAILHKLRASAQAEHRRFVKAVKATRKAREEIEKI